MKVKAEQQGINQYDISASSQEYVEKLKSAYPDMFNIENSIQESENKEAEFIKQIYAKYPNLDSSGIGICSNEYGEYWLLDKEGKKVYFSSFESFEEALKMCTVDEKTTDSANNMSEAKTKYNQIYEGMTYYQVISILGKPYSTTNTSTVKNCIWVINNEIIMVQFMNDVVYQVLFNDNNDNSSESNNDLGNKEEIYINDIDISEMNENQIRKEFEEKGLKVEIEKETRQVDFIREKNEVGMIINSIISDTYIAYKKGDTIKVNILTYEAKPITINLQNISSCNYYGGSIKHCFLTENINDNGKRGANVYFNDKLIYSGNEDFLCTYTKDETIHIKIVVPYLYEAGDYDQVNWQYTVGENYTKDVTVLDVTTTVEELVNLQGRYDGELSVMFQFEII